MGVWWERCDGGVMGEVWWARCDGGVVRGIDAIIIYLYMR